MSPSPHPAPQSRQTFMEEFLRSENRNRSSDDISRMLNDSLLPRESHVPRGAPGSGEIQRVTLPLNNDNNNLDIQVRLPYYGIIDNFSILYYQKHNIVIHLFYGPMMT